ncbi:MAG: thioesterase family protein [Bacteroidota bacterium]|jgi:acyl-CoA thioesterase FadM
MARVKLQLPANFPFCTEIPIRISDINYSGHLGNDAVLSIVHEARIQFLRNLGYSEIDIEGTGIMMTDAIIIYSSEGFYGDVLKVEVGTTDFQLTQCDVVFRLTNTTTKKEVARVKTGIAFFDKQTRKISAVPGAFRKKCELANTSLSKHISA